MTDRADKYVLELAALKQQISMQIEHCQTALNFINSIQLLPDFDTCATQLEKDNISALDTLITNGLAALEAIVWE